MSDKTMVLRAQQADRVEAPWGGLTWYASRKLGNTSELTVGRCVIRPGQNNPMHWHPNCSEVLVVMKGTIMHGVEEGKEVRMEEGDTITIPAKLPHYARNIGTEDAVLMVVFPTADRRVENE